MNKLCCLIVMFLTCRICNAQILCIYCYDQNAPVSTGINNIVINGGFEINTCIPGQYGDCFCPNSSTYDCDISNWTCTGGGTATYTSIFDSTLSIIAEGTKAAYFGNFFSTACTGGFGDLSCMNDSLCRVTGIPAGFPLSSAGYGDSTGVSLQQTITGLTAGNTYVLEFWAGGEHDVTTFTNMGLFAVNVGFGNIFLKDKPTAPLHLINPDTTGTRYIIEFNATSFSHTIKFTNWGHISPNCTELVLDDVRLYTLAELDASVPHCTVGIANHDFENVENIFPNPVTNELNVKTNNTELSEIILYDITSRKLLHQSFIISTSLNTEQLAKGIYLYEVRNKNGVIKKGKVVKPACR